MLATDGLICNDVVLISAAAAFAVDSVTLLLDCWPTASPTAAH